MRSTLPVPSAGRRKRLRRPPPRPKNTEGRPLKTGSALFLYGRPSDRQDRPGRSVSSLGQDAELFLMCQRESLNPSLGPSLALLAFARMRCLLVDIRVRLRLRKFEVRNPVVWNASPPVNPPLQRTGRQGVGEQRWSIRSCAAAAKIDRSSSCRFLRIAARQHFCERQNKTAEDVFTQST